MSVYDYRDKNPYGLFSTESHYSENQYILKWWTPQHDDLLVSQIRKWQWVWYWTITEEIVKVTPTATMEAWRKEDPLCRQYAWYNILMNFAASRAAERDFTDGIRSPKLIICPLCENKFIENSLPMPLIERLGIESLDFCAPCLRDTVLQGTGNNSASKEEILKYLSDLSEVLGAVPSQNFGEGTNDLSGMGTDTRLKVLRVLRVKPTAKRVKAVFDSWFNALIQAGVLEDGTRQNSRGIQSVAKDGHICYSLGEKTIDDFLFSLGIHHEREPHYPEGNYRGDFEVGAVFVEYFGLTGNPEYDVKVKEKIRICKKNNLSLVAIYPQDLANRDKLEMKLRDSGLLDRVLNKP